MSTPTPKPSSCGCNWLGRTVLVAVIAAGTFYGGLNSGARHPAWADYRQWPMLLGWRTGEDQSAEEPLTPEALLKRLVAKRIELENRRRTLQQQVNEDEIVVNVLRMRGEDEDSAVIQSVLQRQEKAKAEMKAAADAVCDARRLEADLQEAITPKADAPLDLPAKLRTDVKAWIYKNRLENGEDPFGR